MIRRREVIIASGGGFVILFCYGITLLCAGLVSFALPATSAVWAYLAQPVVALGLTKLLGPVMGVTPVSEGNELRGLMGALIWVPVMMLPACALIARPLPHYVPALSISVFAAHLVVFAWLWGHRAYAGLGLGLMAMGVALYVAMGKGAFHFSGLAAGVVLMVSAVFAYRYANGLSGRAAD